MRVWLSLAWVTWSSWGSLGAGPSQPVPTMGGGSSPCAGLMPRLFSLIDARKGAVSVQYP